jgi:small-conductance mechanosensitive channel
MEKNKRTFIDKIGKVCIDIMLFVVVFSVFAFLFGGLIGFLAAAVFFLLFKSRIIQTVFFNKKDKPTNT